MTRSPDVGSVSRWLLGANDADAEAARQLWERFFPQLLRVARAQLAAAKRRVMDEEDIALSVFESFWDAVQQNRFPDLTDRVGLWRLLLRMTSWKVIDHRRRFGREIGESVVHPKDAESQVLAELICGEPDPEFVAMMTEDLTELLGQLTDHQLQDIAVAKLEGYTNQEISARLGCSLSTVERRLKLIRETWRQSA